MELTQLELQLLNAIADTTAYKDIANHISVLKIKVRTNTKLGVNIIFEYNSNVSPLLKEGEPLEALLSAPKVIALSQLKNGLGFVLDIESGLITSLDIYVNDISEKWDKSFVDFSVIDKESN